MPFLTSALFKPGICDRLQCYLFSQCYRSVHLLRLVDQDSISVCWTCRKTTHNEPRILLPTGVLQIRKATPYFIQGLPLKYLLYHPDSTDYHWSNVDPDNNIWSYFCPTIEQALESTYRNIISPNHDLDSEQYSMCTRYYYESDPYLELPELFL